MDHRIALCIELHSRFSRTNSANVLIQLLNNWTTASKDGTSWPTLNLSNIAPGPSSISFLEDPVELEQSTLSMPLKLNPSVENVYQPNETADLLRFYISNILNPVVCMLGVVGNLCSILVLTRRRMRATMSCSMERCSHTGLLALALSDTLYCACTAAVSTLSGHQAVYSSLSPILYLKVLGVGFQNTLMRTSTWLTVILAVGRYAAICWPIKSQYERCVCFTRASVLITFLVWTALELPAYWTHTVHEYICPPGDTRYYFLDQGMFARNGDVRWTFTAISASLGFVLPFAILAYCNAHLIRALGAAPASRRVRIRRDGLVKRTTTYGSCITPTLVGIVCAFLLLVTPSEILHFYYYTVSPGSAESVGLAIAVTNLLVSVNFAFNFVLYSCVNVHFRQTWKRFVACALMPGAAATAATVTRRVSRRAGCQQQLFVQQRQQLQQQRRFLSNSNVARGSYKRSTLETVFKDKY